MRYVRSFALFWWDFVVGDDPRVAAGIVLSLGLCALLSRTAVPAWWVAPVGVVGLLTWSVLRASARR